MRELLVSGVKSGAIPVALIILYLIVSWGNAFRLHKEVHALLKQVRERSPEVYRAALWSRYKWLNFSDSQNPERVTFRNIRFIEGFREFLEGAELDDVPSISHRKKVVSRLLKSQLKISLIPFLLLFVGLLSFAVFSVYPYIRGLMYVLEK